MEKDGQHLSDAGKTDVSEQQNGKAEASVASRKRAFLASLAAAPAMLTLRSRSAFAQQINCSVVRSIVAVTSLHGGVQPTPEDINRCAEPQPSAKDQADSLDSDTSGPGRSLSHPGRSPGKL